MSRTTEPVDLSILIGATVGRVYVDQAAAGMLLDHASPGETYAWYVEQPFQLYSQGKTCELDPKTPPSMLPFLSLLGTSIAKVDVTLDGAIRFEFSGEVAVGCGPDPHYEAWQLAGPRGFMVVCLPGGGLAT